jgi:hypothetical protein
VLLRSRAHLQKRRRVQAANFDSGRLETLWKEMHSEALAEARGAPLGSNPNSHFTVVTLCKRLWGSTTPKDLYATHRALCDDRVLFYRLKTRPPTYHVRDEGEVKQLRQQAAFVRPLPHTSVPCFCSTECRHALVLTSHRAAQSWAHQLNRSFHAWDLRSSHPSQ